jgi:hypothetical protein
MHDCKVLTDAYAAVRLRLHSLTASRRSPLSPLFIGLGRGAACGLTIARPHQKPGDREDTPEKTH